MMDAGASPTARLRRRAAASGTAACRETGAAVGVPRYVVCGSLISILFGYELAVLSAMMASVQNFFHLPDRQLALLAGASSFAEVVGAPVGSIIANSFGRRSVLLVSIIVSMVGSFTMAAAPSYEILMAGRIISGLGVGAGGAQASVYLAEMSPSSKRGFNVGQLEVWTNVGCFIGFVLGLGCRNFQSPADFRVMFALSGISTLLMWPSISMIPESPRWLLTQMREAEALQILREHTSEDEADRTFKEVKLELQTTGSWRDFFCVEALHSSLVAVILSIILSFSGIDAVSYYTDRILREAGMFYEADRSIAQVLLAFLKIVMVVLASVNMDRVGRVWCMRVSLAGMTVALVAFFIPGMLWQSTMLAVAGLFSFSAAFCLGAGPCFSLLTSEIWATRLRSVGGGVMDAVRSFLCAIWTIYFLVLADKTSFSLVLGLCAAVCLLGTLAVPILVPETMGRSLEEITATHHASMMSVPRRTSFEYARSMVSGGAWGGRGAAEVPVVAG